MLEIVQWTTADVSIELTDDSGSPAEGALDGLNDAVVTVSQGSRTIEKGLDELGLDPESATINLRLSQEETARLKGGVPGKPMLASVQVNLYYQSLDRDATYEQQMGVLRNLHPRRMP